MRKSFVIGATLFVMGFVACTQPSQPALTSEGTWRSLQPAVTQPTADTYVPDIETSSKDENLDNDTLKKLKTVGKKIQHTFSSGEYLRYVASEQGDVIVGGEHGTVISRTEDLPKLIKQKEKDLKNPIKTKAVGLAPWSGWPRAKKWDNNEIPYDIAQTVSTSDRAIILQALNWWNARMGVQYKLHSGQGNEVIFSTSAPANTCSASVVGQGAWNSYTFNPQYIYLGLNCVDKGRVLHEMAHTAGLYHEQQRCDRDSYVSVTYPSNNGSAEVNQGKRCDSADKDYGLYDFSSRMHYWYDTFSSGTVAAYSNSGPAGRNFTGSWRFPRTVAPSTVFLERDTLSRNDTVMLNVLYGTFVNLSQYGNWNSRYHNWHDVGRIDGDGWLATVAADSPAYMSFGPYLQISSMSGYTTTNGTYASCCSVFFELMTDNISSNTQQVVRIDVLRRQDNYPTPGAVTYSTITERTLVRSDFTAVNQYQQFELDFEILALNPSDKLEFGVYFLDTSNVKVRNVTLKQ
jgi:Astacin (Peptidase family M12A)